MKCKKCGHERFYREQHGPHTGLYCDKCGTWQKWLTESEKRLYGARPEVDLSEVSMLDLVNELKRRLEEQGDER
jgi:late competence protein required for DNA uptake (superfamily II DNA/RNA helicase)